MINREKIIGNLSYYSSQAFLVSIITNIKSIKLPMYMDGTVFFH